MRLSCEIHTQNCHYVAVDSGRFIGLFRVFFLVRPPEASSVIGACLGQEMALLNFAAAASEFNWKLYQPDIGSFFKLPCFEGRVAIYLLI
jgi:hypothetical protein